MDKSEHSGSSQGGGYPNMGYQRGNNPNTGFRGYPNIGPQRGNNPNVGLQSYPNVSSQGGGNQVIDHTPHSGIKIIDYNSNYITAPSMIQAQVMEEVRQKSLNGTQEKRLFFLRH
jgi:hypothetical protein